MKTLEDFLNENKGLAYEKQVRSVLTKGMSGRPSFVRRSKGGGSFSAHDNDIVLNLNGSDYPLGS